MGNYICFCKSNRIESNYECLICWKKITEQHLIKCVYCDITLHVECEKLYKNLGENIGINKYEKEKQIRSQYIRVTNEALNILYDLFSKNKSLATELLLTGDQSIVFLDRDDILGDGIRPREGQIGGLIWGLNLFGKKLEEIRTYLRQTTMANSLVETKINTLEMLKLNFINKQDYIKYTNTNFNKIEAWAYKMMLIYVNACANFFEYLCVPREGYIPVTKKDKIEIVDIDKETFFVKGGDDIRSKLLQFKGTKYDKETKRFILNMEIVWG